MSGEVTEILVIAVPASVGSAAAFGLASAMQQRATKRVPTATALDPRLFVRLVHQPAWVLGVGTVLVGLGLQVVALAFGPLVLVQPLLVTGVLFGTLFSALLAHRALDRSVLLGASACTTGLAVFLTLARPVDTGGDLVRFPRMVPLALVLAVIAVACVLIAVGGRTAPGVRVAALAVATGVLYGVTAGLMKVLTGLLRQGGPVEVVGSPVLYVICVVGPVGFLLSQNTFQQGVLIAPALAIITLVDPLVGFAIGVSWLGEQVDTSVPLLVGETVSVLVLMAGIALLSWRGTQIRKRMQARGASIDPTADRCPEARADLRWG